MMLRAGSNRLRLRLTPAAALPSQPLLLLLLMVLPPPLPRLPLLLTLLATVLLVRSSLLLSSTPAPPTFLLPPAPLLSCDSLGTITSVRSPPLALPAALLLLLLLWPDSLPFRQAV